MDAALDGEQLSFRFCRRYVRSVARSLWVFLTHPPAPADFAAMEVKAMTPALDIILAEICRTGVTKYVVRLVAHAHIRRL